MATAYPNKVDTSTELPLTVDKQTGVDAIVVNRLRDAIIAVEQELGVNPSGDQSTVKDRFDVVFGLIVDLQDIAGGSGVVGSTGPKGDTGSQGIQGEIGPTGPSGSQGIQGDIGPTGPQGIQGIQGIQGNVGPTGPSGGGSGRILEQNTFDITSGTAYGTLTLGQTTSTALGAGVVTSQGLHNYDFVFPASWTGGDVTVTYLGRDGTTISETISTPGPGGGSVHSTKVSVRPLTLTCASPASGTFELQLSNYVCVANYPVTKFVASWFHQVGDYYIVNEDLTNGMCQLSLTNGGSPETLIGNYFVLYEI